MMDNMNFVLRQYPDDKFFGQLSNGHVTQSAWKDGNYIANYSRFGMLLNGEGSHVQGEVCSHADDLYPARQQRPAGR